MLHVSDDEHVLGLRPAQRTLTVSIMKIDGSVDGKVVEDV